MLAQAGVDRGVLAVLLLQLQQGVERGLGARRAQREELCAAARGVGVGLQPDEQGARGVLAEDAAADATDGARVVRLLQRVEADDQRVDEAGQALFGA